MNERTDGRVRQRDKCAQRRPNAFSVGTDAPHYYYYHNKNYNEYLFIWQRLLSHDFNFRMEKQFST